MGKGKKRHNPTKPQNLYGGDYKCIQYDTRKDGTEWCHDDGYMGEYVKWDKNDNNGKLSCKGNRHNCMKLKLKWLASLSEKVKDKYLKTE